jgi:membrane fusion protein
VFLRYSAFPYQKYGEYPGTIASVARASLDTDEARSLLGGDPAEDLKAGPYYRVIVNPDDQFVSIGGEQRALPANMRVEAFVLLDRRRLYQWVMQPLYAFGRTVHQS